MLQKRPACFARDFLLAVCCIDAVVGLHKACVSPCPYRTSSTLEASVSRFTKTRLVVTWQRLRDLNPSKKGDIVSRVSAYVYFFCLEKVKLGKGKL